MIGAKGGPYLKKGEWQVFTGYRYQKSDRHFRGSHEEPNRQAEGSEVINHLNLLDFGATYAVNERFNMSVSVPLIFAERSNPIRDANRVVVDRSLTQSAGVADMGVMGRYWIGSPESNPNQNISLGIGIKLPTGNSNVSDTHTTLTSTRFATVDQSIQPGDGGLGMTLDIQGFKLLWGQATLFGSAAYMVNPLDTNDTLTGRRPSEAIMSVPDQYLARVGIAMPVWVKRGLGAAIAGRIEGLPARDVIGKSNGFRRPGYAISIEPTALWSIGGNNLSFSVPVAIYRNRTRSVPDALDNTLGDAAFADYFFLVGWSRRF